MNKRISSRITRLYFKVQAWLGTAFLVDLVLRASVESSPPVSTAVEVWAVLVGFITGGFLILSIPNVQRFLYYKIWLGVLLGWVLRLTGEVKGFSRDDIRPRHRRRRWLLALYDFPYEGWIRASAHWTPESAQMTGFARTRDMSPPVFVQRDHLHKAHLWPGQIYAAAVLINPVTISRTADNRYQLKVNYANEAYGIYKNRGKQFLYHLLSEIEDTVLPQAEVLLKSSRLHRFLMESSHQPAEITAGGPHQPLRWASAGGLPLVRWRRPGDSEADDWFALFFRDIRPRGWNLSLGASEHSEEWWNVFEVAVREFCEEFVVLEDAPVVDGQPQGSVHQRAYRLEQVARAYPKIVGKLTGSPLALRHRELRNSHDGITIAVRPTRALVLKPVETNFSVETTDDDGTVYVTDNVLFSVNPMEAGIECVFVFKFDLADGDQLLCGEVMEDLDVLVREPVMLLRRSFVEAEIARHGSLGEVLPDQERKRLRGIPAGDYHIFDADIVLRKHRLERLLSDLAIEFRDVRDPVEAARIRDLSIDTRLKEKRHGTPVRDLLEARRHTDWFAQFGRTFAAAAERGSIEADRPETAVLLEMCAVTWKTLELVCQHKIG